MSAHIHVLRRGFGWDIDTYDVRVKTSDAGRTATIGFYHLSKEVIAAAGERGQQYAEECARIETERRAM